ncbi:MAG TPA: OPT/YSL family transporter, partial [Pyrinomonadaceae bacterium]|nr:OPT/YSL family transporter [Pyrinomonadaceae bacterium]
VLGGLLGILMMIPLRRALLVQQHGYLKYPEGTACAQVLIAGASAESRAVAQQGQTITDDADTATTGGKVISIGFIIGFLFNTVMTVFKGWKDVPSKEFEAPFRGGSISLENNPALLGVGYIIGPRIAGIMFAGGALSYLVLIPMIKYFGEGLTSPLAPATKLISEMGIEGRNSIQSDYVLYIGAGAVAAGGIISLARSLPVIWQGIKGGLSDLMGSGATGLNGESRLPRTDRDISMKWVIAGILGLIAAIVLFPQLGLHISTPLVAILGALLIVIFGFLFVTVSSRLTGEIGSSSNPISGMTVATLLLTCLVFLIIGWTQPDPYFVTALSIGGIVCIAASNGGTTSQDLKTGFLVGATPRRQQIAILVGATASALVLGPILIWLNNSSTVYQRVEPTAFSSAFQVPESQLLRDSAGSYKDEQVSGRQAASDTAIYRVWHNTDTAQGATGRYLVNMQGKPVYLVDPGINGVVKQFPDGAEATKYNAPKATLMSYIIKGILNQELPWGLVLLGVMIAIVLELAGIPSLAFAVGLYLPVAISTPIFVGGLVRHFVDVDLRKRLAHRNLSEAEMVAETDRSPGVLLASGYIAGGALAGIGIALATEFLSGTITSFTDWSKLYNPFFAGEYSDALGLVPFWLLAIVLYWVGNEMLLAGRKNTYKSPPR